MTTKTFDFTALNGAEQITRTIRVVEQGGQPWFAAVDVCNALGLSNVTVALRPLLSDEKGLISVETLRGPQTLNALSEAGLYRLTMRSRKPVARPFQDWVTRSVLPAVRKDGGYISGEEKVSSGEMSEDELILKAVSILQSKVERLSAENAVMKVELTHLTVDEYRALAHQYWDQSFKSRLSAAAKKLSLEAGVAIVKQDRQITIHGKIRDTQVNVYERRFLEAAHLKLAA